jgi:hypothetical protein
MEKLWHVIVRVGDQDKATLEDVTVTAFDACDAAFVAEELISAQHPKQGCWAMLVHPMAWDGLLPKGMVAPTFTCDVCRALTAAGKVSA